MEQARYIIMDQVKISVRTIEVLKAVRDSNKFKEYQEYVITNNKSSLLKERRQIPTRDTLMHRFKMTRGGAHKWIQILENEGYIYKTGEFTADGVTRYYFDVTDKGKEIIKLLSV